MLAFDLETASDLTALPLLGPVTAPGNLKDPAKIAAAIEERTAARDSKLALDPDCCRIVAIGYTDSDGVVVVLPCPDATAERDALRVFWTEWQIVGHRPVGFNCVGFDLPVLMQRSRILAVDVPHISLKKYGSADCDDLMLDLSFGGLTDYKSLGFWCKRLALDVPEDTTSGKDIGALVEAGDWDAVVAHCRVDVIKTLALAQRLHPGVR